MQKFIFLFLLSLENENVYETLDIEEIFNSHGPTKQYHENMVIGKLII